MENSMFPDLLAKYYKHYFPIGPWCQWLAAGSAPQPLSHRELSFTLAHDVYIRYLSIREQTDLRNMLQKKCPYKIDIGAVYDSEPSMTRRGTPLARELVFDIDLTDYDEVRTCCDGANICQKCWKFMAIACRILDVALKDDFGFTSILWVYSGRRGIHCWVSCAEARFLPVAARSAVADYLSVVVGSKGQSKKVHLNSDYIHPSIRRALQIIQENFEEIVADQQLISTPEGLAEFSKLIPDENFAGKVHESLKVLPQDSVIRWKCFVQMFESFRKEHNNRRLKNLIEEIQLQWAYPRLDVNVTKGLNHLLKAPFSIHPTTERVCVVFRIGDVSAFDPLNVPALSDLLDEQSVNHAKARAAFKEAVDIFHHQVFALIKEESKRKRAAAEGSLEF